MSGEIQIHDPNKCVIPGCYRCVIYARRREHESIVTFADNYTIDRKAERMAIENEQREAAKRCCDRCSEAERGWVDRLVGLFDDSPLNDEVLQYEREARERMDKQTQEDIETLNLHLPDPSTMISDLERTAHEAGARAERARWTVSDKDLTNRFTDDWNQAPRSMRNYVEESVAEYWYRKGWNMKLKELERRR